MLSFLTILSTTSFLVSSECDCQRICDSATTPPACFYKCSEFISTIQASQKHFLRLSFNCYIEDEQKCAKESKNDTDYYDCLAKKECLIAQTPPKVSSGFPTELWPALHSFYTTVSSSKALRSCDSCRDEYFADDFYACVYANCQEKLNEKRSLLRFVNGRCAECHEHDSETKNMCMWVLCREEIVNKQVLHSDIELGNMTCAECESIVYADQYYNCITLNCPQKLKELGTELQISGICQACKGVNEFEACAAFVCKAEILKLNGNGVVRKNDCGLLLDDEFLECTGKHSLLFWTLALIALSFLLLILAKTLLSDKAENSYQLILS